MGAVEIPASTQMASIDSDGLLMIWEMTTSDVHDKFRFPIVQEGDVIERPSCIYTDQKGYILVVGFTSGIVRVLDLTRRSVEPMKLEAGGRPDAEGEESANALRVIRTYRLFSSAISSVIISKTNVGVVVSRESKQLYFLDLNIKSVNPGAAYRDKLPVLCHTELPYKVMGGTWLVEKGETKFLAVLDNAFLATLRCPAQDERDTSDPADMSVLFRRIDSGMKMATFNSMTKDIFVTGSDKYVKKYGFPALPWEQAR